MVKILKQVFNQTVIVSTMYVIGFVWFYNLLYFLGFSRNEIFVFAKVLFILPLLLWSFNIVFSYFFKKYEPDVYSFMFTGFSVFVAIGILGLNYIFENVFLSSNIKDVILLGLVVGVPSGFFMNIGYNFAKEKMITPV